MAKFCENHTFDKNDIINNPHFKPDPNSPGKYLFPKNGQAYAQAVQYKMNLNNQKFTLFPSSQTFSFPLKTPTPSLFPSTITPSLFPSTITPSLFPSVTDVYLPSVFEETGVFSRYIPIRITVVKKTTGITMNKLIAIMSSEVYCDSYLTNKNIMDIPQLKPEYDSHDITKIAPASIITFVQQGKEIVTNNLARLIKLHLNFLHELISEEILKNTEDVLEYVIESAKSLNLYNIVRHINDMKEDKFNIPETITPDYAFVIAFYCFITNDNKPLDVMNTSRRYSKQVHKLACDMCMASYGLTWLLGSETDIYINKHKNTYILSLD